MSVTESDIDSEPLCRHCGQLWFVPSTTVCSEYRIVEQMQYTVQVSIHCQVLSCTYSGSFIRAPACSYLRRWKRFRVPASHLSRQRRVST
jgi:hypothetical protein